MTDYLIRSVKTLQKKQASQTINLFWCFSYNSLHQKMRRSGTIKTSLFILFQFIVIMASAKTEEQKYKVVRSEKQFEIRFYPSATLATVYTSAKSYRELANPGFRKLAGYIFGNNSSETKISMTAPVHMEISPSGSTMSFVMPSAYNADNLPSPNDKEVKIEKSQDEYFAVISFSGYASDEDIKKYSDKLKDLLTETGISYYGNFRFLGYDPPFRPFFRRNEIIVAVRWDNNIAG